MSSRLPNLIISGVHKAGTTSLFVYLSKHPDVCASYIKEIGFFMPLRDGNPLPPIEEYQDYFKHCRQQRYVLEASPSYLYGREKIADAILHHCGKVRIIMMLREPVDRLNSFYNHIRSKVMLDHDVSLSSFIRESLEQIDDHSRQNYFTRGVREGFYSDYLEPWIERFGDDLRIVFFDDLKKDPRQFTFELCKWLNLETESFQESDFTVENKTVYYKNKGLHTAIMVVNRRMEAFWRRNHALKKKLRSMYYSINADKGKKEEMDSETRKLLENLYRPYNGKLTLLLRKQGYTKLPSWLS